LGHVSVWQKKRDYGDIGVLKIHENKKILICFFHVKNSLVEFTDSYS
jgi:hypothetical protein